MCPLRDILPRIRIKKKGRGQISEFLRATRGKEEIRPERSLGTPTIMKALHSEVGKLQRAKKGKFPTQEKKSAVPDHQSRQGRKCPPQVLGKKKKKKKEESSLCLLLNQRGEAGKEILFALVGKSGKRKRNGFSELKRGKRGPPPLERERRRGEFCASTRLFAKKEGIRQHRGAPVHAGCREGKWLHNISEGGLHR